MSCSKPLPPFVCDSLYYLNRNQLERFSIVCRPLKNFIDRYLHTKPYRVFDCLYIRGGLYALIHNEVQWHPNRDDYSAQQFLASQECGIKLRWNKCDYYSFAEMRSYLGPTIRIKSTAIFEARDHIYNSEHIEQMESIAYLWRDQILGISTSDGSQMDVNNFQPILNSPTILQCQTLRMHNANFSFKDYSVLYSLKFIEVLLTDKDHLWQQYWQQFLEQPGVKPVVVFHQVHSDYISDNRLSIIDLLSKTFSSAVVPNAFKIVFVQVNKPLTEFRETNKTSGEILELKKGLPAEFGKKYLEMFKNYNNYTLERSSI
ncbi:hypothetical protein Ddc_11981 [Ditylenchus destructor]|nr:hypothetical protein Ddc_11981 [Ditylenchus destructor]